MRFALFTGLMALSVLMAAPASAEPGQAYRALYDHGLNLEARAAATPPGERRVRNYRAAAVTFEQALRVRDQQGITDHRIYNALGTVYLGAGDLVRADAHLQRGLANARLMTPADRARLYTTIGYLNALRGDNATARRHYQVGAQLGNDSARRSLTALRPARR